MPTKIKTTCPYCGVGCGVTVDKLAANTEATTVKPDADHPANGGKLGGVLCSKGSALGDTLQLGDRLLHPQINGQQASWDDALNRVAGEFKKAIDEHGPESVAFYVSGQLLTEDYYVANKLMKGYIGAANIDTNSRLCMSSAVAGHKRAFGSDTVPGCYEDFELAQLTVLVGANTAWCHPILFKRIQDARKNNGGQLIAIDPRRSPTAAQADLHLPIKPGTDVLLFNGLLVWLDNHKALDYGYLQQYCNGFTDTLAQARSDAPTLQSVADGCDVDIDLIERFYRAFETTKKTITLFSMGVNQSSQGTDKVNAIINCHLATGRVGVPGASPFSMTGQPNAMGGREVGGLANMLAAHMDFDQAERVQTFWDSPTIAGKPGLKAVELFEKIESGDIKAVWIMATNPAVSLPNVNQVRRALESCEFVAVSDCIAHTDTMKYADVALPAAGWGEKDGTVTNSERRISRQRAFLPQAGESRSDWWIISQVAQRMGYEQGFDYQSAAEVFNEHARLSAFENFGARDFDIGGLAGLSEVGYDSMQPVQWPLTERMEKKSISGTKRLFGQGKFFTPDRRGNLIPVAAAKPANAVNTEYPLTLNTGRLRDHWHTMTRTGKSARLAGHRVEPMLTLHPEDALQFGLRDAHIADVESQWGKATVRVELSKDQRRGEVFLPIHWTDQYSGSAIAGKVVNPAVDAQSGQPEFKHTPVKVSPATMQWHAFVLSRKALDVSGYRYWTKVTGAQHNRYELAGDQALSDTPSWAKALLEVDGELLEYSDPSSDSYRAALITDDQLQAVLVIAKRPTDLPSRDWLSKLFAEDEIAAADRSTLLLAEPPDPAADVGPIVCSCFAVGRNTIQQAITEKGLKTAAEVGGCLKAGTNCGSCVGEIEGLLASTVSQAV